MGGGGRVEGVWVWGSGGSESHVVVEHGGGSGAHKGDTNKHLQHFQYTFSYIGVLPSVFLLVHFGELHPLGGDEESECHPWPPASSLNQYS